MRWFWDFLFSFFKPNFNLSTAPELSPAILHKPIQQRHHPCQIMTAKKKGKKHTDDVTKIRKKLLPEFPESFWTNSGFKQGENVTVAQDDGQAKAKEELPELNELSVSERSTCNTCNMKFDSHVELRVHVQMDDIHRLNLKRKLKNKPPIDEETFEKEFDNLSDGSLSGSGEEFSDDEQDLANERKAKSRAKANVRLQFRDPTVDEGYIVVYKAAIPDESSLRSFEKRGPWAVIMAGGGHFSAAIWNEKGEMIKNKSFHRYTTRRKQGGGQAAADASGKTIKSAGSTLRRYGEQALQQEVRQLLTSWYEELRAVQCIYLRVNKRDKVTLLFGWEGSPIVEHKEKGLCRTIPFSTRRATLKEVTRVYEQLSTVVLSPISLITVVEEEEEKVESKPKPASSSKPSTKSKVPVEKGTAHLKKREPKPVKPDEEKDKEAEEPAIELEIEYVQVIADISEEKLQNVQEFLNESAERKSIAFEVTYFEPHEKLKSVSKPCGLVAIAAAFGAVDILEWLLLNGVPLLVGVSPYLITKAKRVRTFLRKFWHQNPGLHDYAAAEIPGPLTDEDLAASAAKGRQKKKREKEKKKAKDFLAKEAAKPPGTFSLPSEIYAVANLRWFSVLQRFVLEKCVRLRRRLVLLLPRPVLRRLRRNAWYVRRVWRGSFRSPV